MSKKRSFEEQSTDPAAQEMLARAEEMGIGTAFSRADAMIAVQYWWGRHVLQAVRDGTLPPDQRRPDRACAAQPSTPSRPAT